MPTTLPASAVFWGKSDAAGRPNLLLQHLLDTAAVAELLWDRYLSDAVRRPLDEVMGGRGRELYALLGGWHDVGKATPGFQAKVPALAARVDAVGLRTRAETRTERWRHELASAVIVREVLKDRWPREHVDWLWPLLAGHHGRVREVAALRPPARWLRGDDLWEVEQRRLVLRVLDELGGSLPVPARRPSRSRQLALAGHLVMADWIASDEAHFQELTTRARSVCRLRVSVPPGRYPGWTCGGGWRRIGPAFLQSCSGGASLNGPARCSCWSPTPRPVRQGC